VCAVTKSFRTREASPNGSRKRLSAGWQFV
jgi:hypothetical protein